ILEQPEASFLFLQKVEIRPYSCKPSSQTFQEVLLPSVFFLSLASSKEDHTSPGSFPALHLIHSFRFVEQRLSSLLSSYPPFPASILKLRLCPLKAL